MAADDETKSVRDRLIEATKQSLATKGIRGTTVSDVADAAGVSRGWLYRHFPDKTSLIGSAIVRLNETFWAESHAGLAGVTTLAEQIATALRVGREAYDTPGALALKLRLSEPAEFAACAGHGVASFVPDLAEFWEPYLEAARDRGEIHPDTRIAEAAEWVARVLISLGTVSGETLDTEDHAAVLRYIRRYVMPGLRADPADA
ncbi:TetR family transcriptional regulator [Mycobacterium sp. MYCO198283]|uniref:TetR/AcrR family transcriptional regulator n=1 Tax=Mycobacterium sp. MYCO198283 TaxID=2883505 RepID=UPI001E2B48E3|nr:TetR/AcrR family transcriptional regulator [Mycobacterium sp. MYCO198283]MCG5430700.1 TetR family transcriptional regulator [Mycobacterium sp. MYCO198283]